MDTKNQLKPLLFISICLTIHAQLSIDELSFINSRYTSVGNCNDFQYEFPHFRVNYHHFDQLMLDCTSSSIIFRNTEQEPSSYCPDDEDYLNNFRIHFSARSFASIRVNQFVLHGIELASLDDIIQNTYVEYSYYRSQWALLIHLENDNKQQSDHLAIVANDEMIFLLFVTPSSSIKTSIELIFPYRNRFQFNQSSVNVWRIDQGFVSIPKSMEAVMYYQLSKFEFRLFDNETFYLYGTEGLTARRLAVTIDQTPVTCVFDRLLRCTFPILPLDIDDSHRPFLQMIYISRYVFNATLTLNPRIRLNRIPTKHRLTNIPSYEIDLDLNLCKNHSVKSKFSLIVHLSTKDINGTQRYEQIVKDKIPPIDCNATAAIGQQITNLTESIPIKSITGLITLIPIKSITAMHVDLTHQWYEQSNCRSENTRIAFN